VRMDRGMAAARTAFLRYASDISQTADLTILSDAVSIQHRGSNRGATDNLRGRSDRIGRRPW
jgi:hypothetical protein